MLTWFKLRLFLDNFCRYQVQENWNLKGRCFNLQSFEIRHRCNLWVIFIFRVLKNTTMNLFSFFKLYIKKWWGWIRSLNSSWLISVAIARHWCNSVLIMLFTLIRMCDTCLEFYVIMISFAQSSDGCLLSLIAFLVKVLKRTGMSCNYFLLILQMFFLYLFVINVWNRVW